jgi:hypothetical protein
LQSAKFWEITGQRCDVIKNPSIVLRKLSEQKTGKPQVMKSCDNKKHHINLNGLNKLKKRPSSL